MLHFFLNFFQWKWSPFRFLFSRFSTRSEKKAFFPQFHLKEWRICHLIYWHLGKQVLLGKTGYLESELEMCFVSDMALGSLGVFAVLLAPPCGHRLYVLERSCHFIVYFQVFKRHCFSIFANLKVWGNSYFRDILSPSHLENVLRL